MSNRDDYNVAFGSPDKCFGKSGVASLRVKPLPANTVVTHEELALLANEGEDEGIINREEREMIQSIFEFGDTIVREVMIPRMDIRSVPQTATLGRNT